MKKNVISALILSAALISGVSVHADEREDALKSLNSLKIITGYEDGTMRENDVLTYGEAAKMLRSMMNENSFLGHVGIFTETEEGLTAEEIADRSHWANEYISFLQEIRVMKNGIRPDDNITYSELCNMLIRLLGYEDEAEVKTSGDEMYMLEAYCLGLVGNADFDPSLRSPYYGYIENITRGDAAKIINRALDVPRKMIYEYSIKDGYKKRIEKDNTFRNILNKSIPAKEETETDGRKLFDFSKFETLRYPHGNSLHRAGTSDLIKLESDESKIIIDIGGKDSELYDYYIRLERYSSDETENYRYHLDRVGPFSSGKAAITDLKPDSKYNVVISTVPGSIEIDGKVIAAK